MKFPGRVWGLALTVVLAVGVAKIHGEEKQDKPQQWVNVEFDVVDFRKRQQRRFWALKISGKTNNGDWNGALTVKQSEKRKSVVGRVPKGLANATLQLKSPHGHALVFEPAGKGRRQASPMVDLGTLKDDIQGKLSFYDAAYVQVQVIDADGKPLSDASVRGTIRSAPIEEYSSDFEPLKSENRTGVFQSPAMIGPFAFAKITVAHKTLGTKRLNASELERGDTRVIKVMLDGKEDTPPKEQPNEFSKRMAQWEAVLPGRQPADAEKNLRFGQPVKDLRVAVQMDPIKETYSAGDLIKVRLVIQNSGNKPVRFSTLQHLKNIARMKATDLDGRAISLLGSRTLGGGMRGHAHYRLEPGQVVDLQATTVGIGAKAEDPKRYHVEVLNLVEGETCRLSFELPLPGVQIQDGQGNLLVPAEGEWIGTLTTGEVRFVVAGGND